RAPSQYFQTNPKQAAVKCNMPTPPGNDGADDDSGHRRGGGQSAACMDPVRQFASHQDAIGHRSTHGTRRFTANHSCPAASRPSTSHSPPPATRQATAVALGFPLILLASAPNNSAPRIGIREEAIATSSARSKPTATTLLARRTIRGHRVGRL